MTKSHMFYIFLLTPKVLLAYPHPEIAHCPQNLKNLMVIASQETSVSKNGSYLSVGVEKSNCEQLWCDHGLVWKKVILLPVVKGELTSG